MIDPKGVILARWTDLSLDAPVGKWHAIAPRRSFHSGILLQLCVPYWLPEQDDVRGEYSDLAAVPRADVCRRCLRKLEREEQ